MSLSVDYPMVAVRRKPLLIPLSEPELRDVHRHLTRWRLEYRIISLAGVYHTQDFVLLHTRLYTHFDQVVPGHRLRAALRNLRRAGLLRRTWWNVSQPPRYRLTRAGWRELGLVSGPALIEHRGVLARS